MTLTPEERKKRQAAYKRRFYEQNREHVLEYNKQWRINNPEKYKEHNRKTLERGRPFRKENKRKFKEAIFLLKGNKCSQCGLEYNGTNACIFDIHHNDIKRMTFNHIRNIEKSKEELKNCVLLCANCHRMIHHAEV